jgi:hypothetical protein
MYIRRKEMTRPDKDEEREQRIHMGIVVDAYGPEEQALSWYYYLEEHLQFPFSAKCVARRSLSPLKVGEKVEVVGMPSEEDCEHDMFVLILRKSDKFGVPLIQLEGVDVDEDTKQAIEDWHYWVNQGYEL